MSNLGRVELKGPRLFYICARNNQCARPCNEGCLYTGSFFKSKLYNQGLKPSKPISFIKAKDGSWWQVDFDWKYNLPESQRSSPEEIISYSYEQLESYEFQNAIRRAKREDDTPGIQIF